MTTSSAIIPIVVAVVLAFLAYKFVRGVVKFALLTVIIVVALWFLVGSTHGMGLGGLR
jgi:uncharacterized membrane protein required for colicin V production